ncbi:MotE family protein [Vallitalea okinawensis]|uniref:MotE family protein n=1 Tax=Vallitalea okinawensis TaxID=2078660 RepID=UPI000CFBFC0C|nr:hypothetical protein [Vallitalea okinawensis]
MDEFENEEKSSGKGLMIAGIITLAIIAGIIALFYFNVAGVTDKFLVPTLNKVGLFEDLVPVEEVSPYAEWTEEDFVALIDEKEATIKALQEEVNTIQQASVDKDKEITRLQAFEDEQLMFKKQKEEFDAMLVNSEYAPAVNEYIKFYEVMYPENAEKLYKEAVTDAKYSEDIDEYVKTYEEMDEKSAAAVLTEITSSDMELVILILENISTESRAKIMENMDPNNAARITKNLAPSQP